VKRNVITLPAAIHQRVALCGCIVTTEPGHIHTKLCEKHRLGFAPRAIDKSGTDNLDLIS